MAEPVPVGLLGASAPSPSPPARAPGCWARCPCSLPGIPAVAPSVALTASPSGSVGPSPCPERPDAAGSRSDRSSGLAWALAPYQFPVTDPRRAASSLPGGRIVGSVLPCRLRSRLRQGMTAPPGSASAWFWSRGSGGAVGDLEVAWSASIPMRHRMLSGGSAPRSGRLELRLGPAWARYRDTATPETDPPSTTHRPALVPGRYRARSSSPAGCRFRNAGPLRGGRRRRCRPHRRTLLAFALSRLAFGPASS